MCAYTVGSPERLTREHLDRHLKKVNAVESPQPVNNWRPRPPTHNINTLIPHTVIPSGDRHTKVGLPDDQSPDCFKACTISCDQYFSQQLNGSITHSNSRVGNHSINSQSNRSSD